VGVPDRRLRPVGHRALGPGAPPPLPEPAAAGRVPPWRAVAGELTYPSAGGGSSPSSRGSSSSWSRPASWWSTTPQDLDEAEWDPQAPQGRLLVGVELGHGPGPATAAVARRGGPRGVGRSGRPGARRPHARSTQARSPLRGRGTMVTDGPYGHIRQRYHRRLLAFACRSSASTTRPTRRHPRPYPVLFTPLTWANMSTISGRRPSPARRTAGDARSVQAPAVSYGHADLGGAPTVRHTSPRPSQVGLDRPARCSCGRPKRSGRYGSCGPEKQQNAWPRWPRSPARAGASSSGFPESPR
jgi:hypothetical protein